MLENEFDFKAVFEPDDYLAVYGRLDSPAVLEPEISFLENALQLGQPMRILDLACGLGRHANLLAEKGHSVTGIDVTEGFIDMAKAAAQALRVNVRYRVADMRHLGYHAEFDRVIMMFSSFGYFDDATNLAVAGRVSDALTAGGLFCFDMINRDFILRHFQDFQVVDRENYLLIERRSFDSLTGRLHNKRILIRNGVRKDQPHFVRLYTVQELTAVLRDSGMEIVRLYGSLGCQPFTSDSLRMYVVARKR